MKKEASKPLTPALEDELGALKEVREEEIDTRDMPEIRDWSQARRGAFYRGRKQQITLLLDADLIDWFLSRSRRAGSCQADINKALREYMARHRRKSA